MKTLPFIFFLIVGLNFSVFSQSDSVAIAKADWVKQRIAPGVVLKTCWFQEKLFGTSQNLSIVEIKPRKRNVFDLGYSPKVLRTTNEFGASEQALAALNGTFFDIANGGSVDYIRSDMQVINENRLNKDGSRASHQRAALVFKNGKLSIAKWDNTNNWESKIIGEDVMVTGPLLLFDQKAHHLDSNSFNNTRHPRSAIAITKKGKVLLVTADGRSPNSSGLSLPELTSLMKWLDADDAVNLDGGGSTALWVGGKRTKGIVNYPSDNKKWDHEGVRKVANVVLLKKK